MKNYPRPRITTIAYHVALWPVVLGVVIVLVWYFKRYSWSPIVGIGLLYVAVPVNLVTALVLSVQWIRNNRKPADQRFSGRYFFIPLLVLMMTYGVAYVCLTAGYVIGCQTTIVIINDSEYVLKNVQLEDPNGISATYPEVESNDKMFLTVYPKGEGPVILRFLVNGQKKEAVPIGYLSWGMDQSGTVLVDKELNVQGSEAE